MSQAIVTRFIGPTNTKGARLSARCDARRIVVPWPYEKNVSEAHAHAAHELASDLGWRGVWIGGCLPSKHKDGFVFVNVDTSADVIEVSVPREATDYPKNEAENRKRQRAIKARKP